MDAHGVRARTTGGETCDAALRGGDRRPHPIRRVCNRDTRVGLGHARRRHGELREPIGPIHPAAIEPPARVELAHLAADPHRMAL
jgi:hypothetical protein